MSRSVDRLKSFGANWFVWLFPLFALILTGSLISDYFKKKGPVIKITFNDASSIEPEKTKVRYRGVTIGKVTDVKLTDDFGDVVVHVSLQKEAKRFAKKGAKFQFITPKVGIQGISGIETIFNGPYIAAVPGDFDAPDDHEFKGQLGGDTNALFDDTSAYLLETDLAGSVSVGDPVSYRGVKIGSVTKLSLSNTAQLVMVQINIENRYVKLIRTNTIFWRKVAVQAKLGLFKSELKINSFDSMMTGGIELAVPDVPGKLAKAMDKFRIASDPPQHWQFWSPNLDL